MRKPIDLTGGARPRPTAPPGPGPAATLRGSVPLPLGAAVRRPDRNDPGLLTPAEKEDLFALGWRPGDDVPPGLAAQVAAARAEAARDVPPPVDPRTPPLRVETVRVEDLPEARRKEILGRARAMAASAASPAPRVVPVEADPTGQFGEVAARTAYQAAGRFEFVDDLDEPPPAPVHENRPAGPPPPAAPVHENRPADPPPADAGAAAAATHCPHCAWPLDQPDDADPDEGDDLSFLQAALGDRPFVKEYRLLDGQLLAAFRTLTLAESDAVHRQAMAELRRGELTTPADFYERVARLRFYVQLLSVRGPASHHDLPDGLSPETNPHAEAHWRGTDGGELLLEVAGYVHANVCAQETLFRALLGCCHRFNRTAARLQAEIDSRDFTRPTRPAS